MSLSCSPAWPYLALRRGAALQTQTVHRPHSAAGYYYTVNGVRDTEREGAQEKTRTDNLGKEGDERKNGNGETVKAKRNACIVS